MYSFDYRNYVNQAHSIMVCKTKTFFKEAEDKKTGEKCLSMDNFLALKKEEERLIELAKHDCPEAYESMIGDHFIANPYNHYADFNSHEKAIVNHRVLNSYFTDTMKILMGGAIVEGNNLRNYETIGEKRTFLTESFGFEDEEAALQEIRGINPNLKYPALYAKPEELNAVKYGFADSCSMYAVGIFYPDAKFKKWTKKDLKTYGGFKGQDLDRYYPLIKGSFEYLRALEEPLLITKMGSVAISKDEIRMVFALDGWEFYENRDYFINRPILDLPLSYWDKVKEKDWNARTDIDKLWRDLKYPNRHRHLANFIRHNNFYTEMYRENYFGDTLGDIYNERYLAIQYQICIKYPALMAAVKGQVIEKGCYDEWLEKYPDLAYKIQ